jgi:uracil-DNA glycosylase
VTSDLQSLLTEIRECRICEPELPLGARPVLAADPRAVILIAGQAPGARVHASGVPWDDDPSSRRLCVWLGMSQEELHDPARVALVPMGFCYPGTGRSGDLPPRPECRQLWHDRLFERLPNLRLRIVIGQYAQAYHLAGRSRDSLTETVAAWRELAPACFPLPHPSPRNQIWLRRNPWFETELLPALRQAVAACMSGGLVSKSAPGSSDCSSPVGK